MIAAGFTIRARVFGDGKRDIVIMAGRLAEALAEADRRRAEWTNTSFAPLVDCKIVQTNTLVETRAALMTCFGIEWFNRARGRLLVLEAEASEQYLLRSERHIRRFWQQGDL